MSHISCKSWKTIRKISNDPSASTPPCLVSVNEVALLLIMNGRGNMLSRSKRPVPHPATEVDIPWYTLLAKKGTGKNWKY